MRRTTLLPALLLFIATGCPVLPPARPVPTVTIPPASAVEKIHLKSIGSSLNHEYDVTLTKEADVQAVLDWLNQVNWSPAKAQDLSNVGLAEVGSITLTKKDGSVQTFGLSGGMVIVNRWQWDADTEKLAEIARQAGAKIP